MAKYRMLVGTVVYYEIPIEADSSEQAKEKIDDAFSHMDTGWNSKIYDKIGLTFSMEHKLTEYHGIKEGSIVEVQETVVG